MPKPMEKEELAEIEGEYSIREQTKQEKARTETTVDDIPAYKISLDLTEDQSARLSKQFKEEFEALIAERKSLGLDAKWMELDRQYDGILRKNPRMSFNLHTHQSKIKTDTIVRALNEAFLESDPLIDVSPRPEMWREQDKNDQDVCEKQQQFLQYEVQENIKPERELTRIGLCAVKKFVGIGKVEWQYEKEKRKREEVYEGKNENQYDGSGKPIGITNKALKEFLNNYPDAPKRYPQLVKRIQNEETVSLVVEYLDTVVNCAKLKYVDLENFYVKNSTFYHDGLKKAHLVVERDSMTYYELKKKEQNKEFNNVDNIMEAFKGIAVEQSSTKQTIKTRDYPILEATTYFEMNEGDEEEVKVKAWFAEINGKETRFQMLGCTLYPYFGFDIDYIPFYVKINNKGFYGNADSVMADLRDSNIADDALLNMSLHSIWIRNTLTPIVPEGSEIAQAFIEGTWQDGKPLEVDAMTEDVNKAVNFVQYPQMDLQGMIALGQILKKQNDDVTGVQSAITGRQDPTDPHAPASKTIALLNQAGVNIKDYIRQFLPSFNVFVGNVMQLYYQMSQEGRKFQVGYKSRKVTGTDPWPILTRDEMVARTNIQSRAAAFAFDKAQEKMEANMAMQGIMGNPIAQVQPGLLFKAFKVWLKLQGKEWQSIAENDLLSPAEFDQKQMQTAIMAVMQIVQQAAQEKNMTGTSPSPDLEVFKNAITQAQILANNQGLAAKQKEQAQK